MIDYRRIDIDSLDPENVVTKEELIPPQQPVSPADIESRAQQVRQSLQKGDHAGALKVALENPPYGGDENTKTLHLKTVIEILTTVKSSEITPLVEGLNSENQNTLFKYLYKGMGSQLGQSHGNGGVLLSWFEKAVEVVGQGGVTQYISDRRTV